MEFNHQNVKREGIEAVGSGHGFRMGSTGTDTDMLMNWERKNTSHRDTSKLERFLVPFGKRVTQTPRVDDLSKMRW